MTQIRIPEFLQNNLPKFVITEWPHPVNHPFEYHSFDKGVFCNDNIRYRQYEETTDKAVKHFIDQVDSIDTGCIQLWQLNENNQTWFEMGMINL